MITISFTINVSPNKKKDRTQSNPVQPNPTQSNPIQPNPTQSNPIQLNISNYPFTVTKDPTCSIFIAGNPLMLIVLGSHHEPKPKASLFEPEIGPWKMLSIPSLWSCFLTKHRSIGAFFDFHQKTM